MKNIFLNFILFALILTSNTYAKKQSLKTLLAQYDLACGIGDSRKVRIYRDANETLFAITKGNIDKPTKIERNQVVIGKRTQLIIHIATLKKISYNEPSFPETPEVNADEPYGQYDRSWGDYETAMSEYTRLTELNSLIGYERVISDINYEAQGKYTQKSAEPIDVNCYFLKHM